jgi:UDP-N-acetylmuramoyl-L-alanyl-D-glutamate--2,6-diaminopimelate ligase
MGAAAARFADHIVLTDDNPRNEDPGVIVADIRAGLAAHPDVWVEHDRHRAITDAIEKAGVDDVVLVAGKGHEDSQWIAGEQRQFSDCVVVEDALGGRG